MSQTAWNESYPANANYRVEIAGDLDGVTVTTAFINSGGDVARQSVSYDTDTLDQLDGLIDRLSRSARDIRQYQQFVEEQLRKHEDEATAS